MRITATHVNTLAFAVLAVSLCLCGCSEEVSTSTGSPAEAGAKKDKKERRPTTWAKFVRQGPASWSDADDLAKAVHQAMDGDTSVAEALDKDGARPWFVTVAIGDTTGYGLARGYGDTATETAAMVVADLKELTPLFTGELWTRIEVMRPADPENLPSWGGLVVVDPGGDPVDVVLAEELAAARFDVAEGLQTPIAEVMNELTRRRGKRDLPKRMTLQPIMTRSFVVKDGQLERVFRGHMRARESEPSDWTAAAEAGARYLSAAVLEDGSFVYRFDARSGEGDDGYNMLRHAGTIYAMLEVYEQTQDAELLASIDAAIGFLLSKVGDCPTTFGNPDKMRCLDDDGYIKLGGNALAIVALTKHAQVTDSKEHLPVIQAMATWIVATQGADGQFLAHKVDQAGAQSEFVSAYYPGEAILALMRLHQIDGNRRWADSAEAAANWLINVRDDGLDTDALPHDHWLLYGIADVYRARPDMKLLDHGLRIASSITATQHGDDKRSEWRGGFMSPPRAAPTATRSEGLCALLTLESEAPEAFEAARAANRTLPSRETLENTLQSALVYLLRTVIGPELALFLPQPEETLGGVRRSHNEFEVRIDYVQHNASAFVCAANLFSKTPEVPEEPTE